jgi:hypothetical protein
MPSVARPGRWLKNETISFLLKQKQTSHPNSPTPLTIVKLALTAID